MQKGKVNIAQGSPEILDKLKIFLVEQNRKHPEKNLKTHADAVGFAIDCINELESRVNELQEEKNSFQFDLNLAYLKIRELEEKIQELKEEKKEVE